ncbi:hypothetical protein H5410_011377 [Solanum commersonii]|uniref:Uncharacterized protein n=1 Tax=Solanum commersonii TaxID=4109 RepID=A0A9J6APZ8_SOLCO|nr:hypothetical protein H5410_011377 [Solanum commersonii]
MESHHYNQFQRLMDKDNSGGSSSHSYLSDSANMGARHIYRSSESSKSRCGGEVVVPLFIAPVRCLVKEDIFPFKTQSPSHPVFLENSVGFLDDMVQANPSNHVEQAAVPIVVNEPAVDDAPPVIARQSTRPRKPPFWMTDFITNTATESTLYPLSQKTFTKISAGTLQELEKEEGEEFLFF